MKDFNAHSPKQQIIIVVVFLILMACVIKLVCFPHPYKSAADRYNERMAAVTKGILDTLSGEVVGKWYEGKRFNCGYCLCLRGNQFYMAQALCTDTTSELSITPLIYSHVNGQIRYFNADTLKYFYVDDSGNLLHSDTLKPGYMPREDLLDYYTLSPTGELLFGDAQSVYAKASKLQ